MSETTKVQAVIVDGDNTLWRGRAAEGIGKAYLLRELKHFHLPTFFRGLEGAKQVNAIVREVGGVEGEMQGQKRFYEILVENGLGTKKGMYQYASRYIDSHLVWNVSDLLYKNLDQEIPVFLATASGTSAASYAISRLEYIQGRELRMAAVECIDLTDRGVENAIKMSQSMFKKFRLANGVFNSETFDKDGRLTGIEMTITTGENKLAATVTMLDKFNIRVGDCMMVGDSGLDVPLLKSAKVAIASPFANEEVKAVKGIMPIRT